MMRRIFALSLLITFLGGAPPSWSQPAPVQTRTVAPGVVHYEYTLSGPFTLDVLEVATDNPFITLESFRPHGLTKTTVQAAANDREGHRVIGAINADFFSFETGWPVGNQIVNGEFALGVASSRSHFAMDDLGRPSIDRLSFTGRVIAEAGEAAVIHGVNTGRSSGMLIFTTPFRGSATGTDGSGAECAVEYLSAPVGGDTLAVRVLAKSVSGNMSIPSNGGVLSGGSGAPAAFLNDQVGVGDTLKLYLGFTAGLRRITQVLGGAGRILMGGRNVSDSMRVVEGIGSDFITARHPRTFLGFNKDTSKLYLCTVDGRQTTSLGMSFNEMASFLLSIGAWDAFNFDGGGSTTMVVRGGIVNSPSDPAGERSVANSLQVISTAPLGTLHHLDLQPKRAALFQGNSLQFTASGTDQYFNPIPLPGDVSWEADASIGTISQTGLLTARSANDSGWVRLRWNSVVDSAFVVVRVLTRMVVAPSSLVMIPGEQVMLIVRGEDSGGNRITLQNAQVAFSSLTPAANVNASGLVTATDFGQGLIRVVLDTLKVDVPFSATASDTNALLDGFDDMLAWSPVIENSDTSLIRVDLADDIPGSHGRALRIVFSIPLEPARVLLHCVHPIAGRPDSVFARVAGAGNGDTLRLRVKDKDGQEFVIDATQLISWKDEWRDVGFRLNRAVGSGTLDYPVSVTQLSVAFGNVAASGGFVNGTLAIDDLQVHYPVRIVTPTVLWDFESGITGWLTPTRSNAAQLKGVNIAASTLVASTERAYQGVRSGKWTFVDDAASSVDWDVRMPRGTDFDFGILRGSYVGAWVYAEGSTDTELHIVIRGGNGQICSGPPFPVSHVGWKLIGAKLDPSLFTYYLTSGVITESGNKFNGFRLRAPNSKVNGQSRTLYIDRLVTSALTVPTGFTTFSVTWNAPLARLHWSVNSEMSVSRYIVERGMGGIFTEVGFLQAAGNADSIQHYEYVDTPPAGGTYEYRVRQVTNDGAQEFSRLIGVNTATGEILGVLSADVPEFALFQNYPNPFNPSTVIRFCLPARSRAKLEVVNLLGQRVATLVDEELSSGYHQVEWSPAAASGLYFCRLEATSFAAPAVRYVAVKKMALVR